MWALGCEGNMRRRTLSSNKAKMADKILNNCTDTNIRARNVIGLTGGVADCEIRWSNVAVLKLTKHFKQLL